MSKSLQNHQEKEKNAFWLLNPASKVESILLVLFFLFLPTQFGKHFWPNFSFVSGIRIDYLSPILYTTDIIIRFLFGALLFRLMNNRLNISTKSLSKAKKSLTTRSPKRWHEIFRMKILARQKLFFIFFLSIFIVANIGFSLSPLLALYGWIKVAELAFIAFYLARTITSRVQLIFISFLFAIGAFFESILAIFQYLNQESLNGVFYFFGERAFTGDTPGIANASIDGTLVLRPYGTFSHPNVLAGYLLVSLVMIWSFLLRSTNRWIQLFAGLTLLVASIALLLSLGRVAISLWALIVIGIFLRVFVRRMQELHTKLIVLGIFLIALSGIAALHIPRQIVMRFSQTSLFEQSVTERTELLTASTTMISNHPLLGVGVENFIPALAPLQKPMPLGLYLQPVHNIFVLVATETGLIGLALFVWLLIATTIRIRRLEKGMRLPFVVLFLIIVATGSFDHYWLTLQQGQLLFAVILGLSWANLQKL